MQIVIGKFKVELSADGGYWLIVNEGRDEGEGMEITDKLAKKFEALVAKFYEDNF
mgnify:CR=1 FL=1